MNLKKILIADDELLVRVGLRSSISWEDNGYTIVGEAKNGKEAINLFFEKKPDIIITDIRMPFIDGLQLIKKIKEKNSRVKIIILSHHNDFDYAKEAIRYGASDYILKTDLRSDLLIETLNRISQEIDTSTDKIDTLKRNNTIQETLKKIIRHDYSTEEELNDIMEGSTISSWDKTLTVACASPSNPAESNYADNDDFFIYSKNIAESLTTGINETYCIQSDSNEFIFIFTLDKKTRATLKNEVENKISKIINNWNMYLSVNFNFGISDFFSTPAEIPENIVKARKSLQSYYFNGKSINWHVSKKKENVSDIQVDINKIKKHLKNYNKEELLNYIDSLFRDIKKSGSKSTAKRIFIDLISLCRLYLADTENTALYEQVYNKYEYSIFDSLININSVESYICGIMIELLEISKNGYINQEYSYPIKIVISYIHNNFERDLTLDNIASYSNLSKSYLSYLFKAETGENLSKYIANYRIKKSKELLVNTDLRIYQIAEKVGFDNPYYFSRVFKEFTRMSCKQFRDQNYRT